MARNVRVRDPVDVEKTDQAMLDMVRSHLKEFCGWFNDAAKENGLDVAIDADDFMASTRNLSGRYLRDAARQVELIPRGMHKEQIQTALAVTSTMIDKPGQSGAVLGALQSGKTGTSHGLMFSAPIIQMLTGAKYLPLYLNTNQVTHRTQSQNGLEAFLRLYGGLTIRRTSGEDHAGATSLLQHFEEVGIDIFEGEDEVRPDQTCVNDYMETAFSRTEGGDAFNELATNLSFARSNGRRPMERIREYFDRANRNGYAVMMVVDEPQWGATDMPDETMPDGYRSSVLNRILDMGAQSMLHYFDPSNPNIVIGLSATPYAFMGAENLFVVKQRIGPGYVGFGYFNGERMYTGPMPMPPTYVATDSFEGVGMNDITYQLFGKGGEMKPRDRLETYVVNTSRGPRPMKPTERAAMGAENLLSLLDQTIGDRHRMAEPGNRPVGCMLRIMANSRDNTDTALTLIGEESEDFPYNVIRFYDDAEDKGDMAGRIAKATAGDPRPYLAVVVGKGRMGDALPPSCEVAIDLSAQTADMNALLQGAFGRMCGYGKRDPLVVLSAKSCKHLRNYDVNFGINDSLPTSKGTQTHNPQVSPTVATRLTITRDMMENAPEGSPLALMLAEIEQRVAYLDEAPPSVRMPQRRGVNSQAHEMALAPLMEALPELLKREYKDLFPHFGEPPRILPLDGKIRYDTLNGDAEYIGWARSSQKPDMIRVLTRYNDGEERGMHRTFSERRIDGIDESQIQGRGKRRETWGATRMRDGKLVGVMPFLTFSKVDAEGNPLGKEGKTMKGRFVLDAITFDLERPVHLRAAPSVGRKTMPDPSHANYAALTPEERATQLGERLCKLFEKADHSHHESSGRRRSYKHEFQAIRNARVDVQRALNGLYDEQTHALLPITRGSFQIVSRKTGKLDNPNGPATLDFSDPDDIKLEYFKRGRHIASFLDYHGTPAMQPPPPARKRSPARQPEPSSPGPRL